MVARRHGREVRLSRITYRPGSLQPRWEL